ncbi:adenylate/guanylate cyclase domain-containing protein [Chitinimonas koreensis]|uniref:adenylate/guanylate cyclase domain-containing protein n=1 Tax=Chitinimonas koreensis TaxID=356302 RepID=UPI0004265617|nr:adenylate/guanylate cyclase domain-containing protein [Chitinimonas koreensis]QNM98591.1 adenylate/guanylate cyclase domain-containing protein [Chitinimonas koreensis]
MALLHPLPLKHPGWLAAALAFGLTVGGLLAAAPPTTLDVAHYDYVMARSTRPVDRHVAWAAPDLRLPLALSRQQMLPLYALAAERVAALGGRAVFIDAQVALRNYRMLDFGQCIEPDGGVQLCSLRGEPRCSADDGYRRSAPLDLNPAAMRLLVMPYPLSDRTPIPYDLLFGARHAAGGSLPRFASSELPLSRDGVVRQAYADRDGFLAALRSGAATTACAEVPGAAASDRRCVPIRFGTGASWNGERTPLQLSWLASCRASDWQGLRAAVAGRTVVLQLTDLDEPTDLHITPLLRSAANLQLTLGPQIVADSVETAASGDAPRRLPFYPSLGLAALAALVATILFAGLDFGVALAALAGLAALAWRAAPAAYPWVPLPASAIAAAALASAALVTAAHLRINTRRGRLLRRFLPAQVHHLLLSSQAEALSNREVQAQILMSDLAGYTTLTNLLGTPKRLFGLLNDYLDEITRGLQRDYDAWLEAYVGDMVCYYWPALELDGTPSLEEGRRRAVRAAALLLERQHAFFAGLPAHLAGLPDEQVERIRKVLGAGIALTEGMVMLGELGPADGVRKFGILGDPINLCARLEALTRKFNSRLIVTAELREAAAEAGLMVRRLGRVQVKGRLEALEIWGVEVTGDAGLAEEIAAWERWLAAFEAAGEGEELAALAEPNRYRGDVELVLGWRLRGIWNFEDRVFHLDEK